MAATWSVEMKQAALNAALALLNNGSFRVLTSGDAELAAPTFNSTAFQNATSANPPVATANALNADSSITGNAYFTKFEMRTSGAAVRINGSIGTSGTDIIVADNYIPSTATSFNIGSLTVSLQIT